MWSNSEIKSFQNEARAAAKDKLQLSKSLDLKNALEEQKLRNQGSTDVANIGKDTKQMELEAEKNVTTAKAGYYDSEANKNVAATGEQQLNNAVKSRLLDDVVETGKTSLRNERVGTSFDTSVRLRNAMNQKYDVNQVDSTVGLSGQMQESYYDKMGAGSAPVATPGNTAAQPIIDPGLNAMSSHKQASRTARIPRTATKSRTRGTITLENQLQR